MKSFREAVRNYPEIPKDEFPFRNRELVKKLRLQQDFGSILAKYRKGKELKLLKALDLALADCGKLIDLDDSLAVYKARFALMNFVMLCRAPSNTKTPSSIKTKNAMYEDKISKRLAAVSSEIESIVNNLKIEKDAESEVFLSYLLDEANEKVKAVLDYRHGVNVRLKEKRKAWENNAVATLVSLFNDVSIAKAILTKALQHMEQSELGPLSLKSTNSKDITMLIDRVTKRFLSR